MRAIRKSKDFDKHLNRLPKDAKLKLPKICRLLASNPRYPSLHLKKIKKSIRKDIYECRVDDFWRLVVRDMGDMFYALLYVGPHDDAIKFGSRVREQAVPYGEDESSADRLNLYLAGDDTALSFVDTTLEELGVLMGEKMEG